METKRRDDLLQWFKSCWSSCKFQRICKSLLLHSYSSRTGQVVKSHAETKSLKHNFWIVHKILHINTHTQRAPYPVNCKAACILLLSHCEIVTQINLPHYIPRSKRTPALHLEATLAIMVSFQERNMPWMHINLCAEHSSSTQPVRMLSQGLGKDWRLKPLIWKMICFQSNFYWWNSLFLHWHLWTPASLVGIIYTYI